MHSLLPIKNSLFEGSIASVCFVLWCWTSPDILHVAACLPHARRARHPLPLAVGAHVNPPEEETQSRVPQSYIRALKDAKSINIKIKELYQGFARSMSDPAQAASTTQYDEKVLRTFSVKNNETEIEKKLSACAINGDWTGIAHKVNHAKNEIFMYFANIQEDSARTSPHPRRGTLEFIRWVERPGGVAGDGCVAGERPSCCCRPEPAPTPLAPSNSNPQKRFSGGSNSNTPTRR